MAVAVAGFALLATFLTVTPAGALRCDQGTSDRVIHLENEDIGTPTTIAVHENSLFVNDVDCGEATSVAIVDVQNVEVADDIIIDLTEPFRINGAAVPVTLNLDPDATTGERDRVRVIGSGETDRALLFPDNLVVNASSPFGDMDDTRLTLTFQVAEIDLEIELGAGHDTFETRSQGGVRFENDLKVEGGTGNDIISGGPNADVLRGNEGRDILEGKGGADDIAGGPDNDTIRGGSGADNLRGQAGNDTILGQSGQDTITGGSGVDEIRGGTAADTISGGGGADELYGNTGADTIRGGTRGDYIKGGKGRDVVFGNSGNDEFDMGDGFRDTVSGGPGNRDICDVCDSKDTVRKSVELGVV